MTSNTDAGDQQLGTLIRSGAKWKFASQATLQISRVLFAFALARLLTPSEYGVAGMALVLTSYVLVFSDLALGAALVQRATITEAEMSTTFWTSVASGAVLSALGLVLAGPVSSFFDEPEVKPLFIVVSLTFFITSLAATQRALLTRAMDFRALELRVIIATLVSGIAAVVVAALGYGPWAIVAQYVTFAVLSTAFILAVSPWRPRFVYSVTAFRSMFAFSANVLGNRFLYVSEEAVTSGLIGRLLGAPALGIYSIATNVVLAPLSRITVPIAEVLFPAFSRIQNDKGRIADLWTGGLPYVAMLTMPALAGLVIVAPEFVDVVLGPRWEEVTPVLRVLAWVGLLRSIQGWNSSIALALGRADALFRLSIASLAVAAGAIVAGAPFGLVGVAIVYAVLTTGIHAIWLRYCVTLVGIRMRDVLVPLVPIVAATVCMVPILVAIKVALLQLGVSSVWRLLALVVAGCLVYPLAVRVCAPQIYKRVRDVLLRRLAPNRQVPEDAGQLGAA